jgi:hypothetical protein
MKDSGQKALSAPHGKLLRIRLFYAKKLPEHTARGRQNPASTATAVTPMNAMHRRAFYIDIETIA